MAGYLGVGIGMGPILAALLDASENFALINLAFGSQRESWPIIARWCALVKFGIVGAGLAYILTGTLFILMLEAVSFRRS